MLHTALVPSANLGISNTPIGPFQITVLAPSSSLANNSTVLGPISRPMYPSGTSSPTTLISPSSPNLLLTTESIGRINLSPPFSMNDLAKSTLSSSTNEEPTVCP